MRKEATLKVETTVARHKKGEPLWLSFRFHLSAELLHF